MSGWRLRDENDVEHYSDRPSIGNGDRLERIQADLARDDARNIPWPETTWDDLSWLVAEVERLRAEVETLKAMLLTPMDAMEAMRAAENERLGAKVARYEALLDPDNDERVQRLAERMVRARAAHHGPGFSTWPTAVHAEAAAVLAALREEAGDV